MAFSYKSADDYAALLGRPEVEGFLEAVRDAEGTSRGRNPYAVGFNFTPITSFDDHPRVSHPFSRGRTTAAGAYQALRGTWDEVAKAIGLPDFSPRSQDIFALARADFRGALPDVLSGNIRSAVNKSRKEWASFPNANYPGQKMRSMSFVENAYQRGFNRALNTPANMSRTAVGFSVSPNRPAIGPGVAMRGGNLIAGTTMQPGFTAVPTPSFRSAPAPSASRGYTGRNSPAGSLSNAKWAGTNLSGTSFGMPADYTSQRALAAQARTAPAPANTPANMGAAGFGISPTPARGSSASIAQGVPTVADIQAFATRSGIAPAVAAAPVSRAPAGTPGNMGAAGYGISPTPAPANAITAAPVASVPDLEATRRTGPVRSDQYFRDQTAARNRETMSMGRNAQRGTTPDQEQSIEAEISRQTALTPNHVYTGVNAPGRSRSLGIPSMGTVIGGLLGSMVAGPIGGLLGAVIGSGGLKGISDAIGSRGSNTSDNSGLFSVANPSGGRGLLDLSGGPVSLGSITATPTPSSGGYRSVDSSRRGTGWSSYTNPQTGITTTFDAQGNTLGGPGMASSVGGNSPGGK